MHEIDESLYKVPSIVKKYIINIKDNNRVLVLEPKKNSIMYLFNKDKLNSNNIMFCKDIFFNAIKVNLKNNFFRFIIYNWDGKKIKILTKTERAAKLVYENIDNNNLTVVGNQEININLNKRKYKKFGNTMNLFVVFPILDDSDNRICVPEIAITDNSIVAITEDNYKEIIIDKKNNLVAFNNLDLNVDSYLISANLK
jgi:hypothetical protein